MRKHRRPLMSRGDQAVGRVVSAPRPSVEKHCHCSQRGSCQPRRGQHPGSPLNQQLFMFPQEGFTLDAGQVWTQEVPLKGVQPDSGLCCLKLGEGQALSQQELEETHLH